MDNLCHTLVGAALAESGLKRRTTLGTATLLIGANFPDIDVVAVPLGHGLGFRRGITHAIPALIVLPFVLTGIMLLWHRARAARRDGPAPAASQLLLLSAISMATHPVLDWMNTYGMRWFMPFSGWWSYIDVLFIIDPWIWAALLAGVLWSRRRERPWRRRSSTGRAPAWVNVPARVALALVIVYIGIMVALSRATKREIASILRSRGVDPVALLASPVPIDPFRRRVVYERDGEYVFAEFDWRASPRLSDDLLRVPRQTDDRLARLAAATPAGQEFLSWSRLPFYSFERHGDSAVVYIADARYAAGTRGSWASVRVVVPLR
ncbi:MAG TPA: metal-dependent hydrolase [Gemmatimonadaceae bacterium]